MALLNSSGVLQSPGSNAEWGGRNTTRKAAVVIYRQRVDRHHGAAGGEQRRRRTGCAGADETRTEQHAVARETARKRSPYWCDQRGRSYAHDGHGATAAAPPSRRGHHADRHREGRLRRPLTNASCAGRRPGFRAFGEKARPDVVSRFRTQPGAAESITCCVARRVGCGLRRSSAKPGSRGSAVGWTVPSRSRTSVSASRVLRAQAEGASIRQVVRRADGSRLSTVVAESCCPCARCAALGVHPLNRRRHRGRLDAATRVLVGPVEEPDDEHAGDDDRGHRPDHHRLHDGRLRGVGVEAHVRDDQRATEEQRQPDERGDQRLGFRQTPTPPSLRSAAWSNNWS